MFERKHKIMPTYDYECDACGHRFELFQSMKDLPIKKCPSCKKSKARRLIGAGAGIIFKGSGFYCTDYRSNTYSDAAKKDTAAGSATAAPAKSETKPAAEAAPSSSSETKSSGNGKSDKASKK